MFWGIRMNKHQHDCHPTDMVLNFAFYREKLVVANEDRWEEADKNQMRA